MANDDEQRHLDLDKLSTSSRHAFAAAPTCDRPRSALLFLMRRIAIVVSLLFCAQIPAQESTGLQKAILLEEQEHDLRGAEAAYQSLTNAGGVEERAQAWLRLGKLYRRVGQEDKARAAFKNASSADGDTASQARTELEKSRQDPKRVAALRAKANEILDDPGNFDLWVELPWLGKPIIPVLLERATKRPDLYAFALHIGGDVMVRRLQQIREQKDLKTAIAILGQAKFPETSNLDEPVRKALEDLLYLDDPTGQVQSIGIFYLGRAQQIRSRKLVVEMTENSALGINGFFSSLNWERLDDSLPFEEANARMTKALRKLCERRNANQAFRFLATAKTLPLDRDDLRFIVQWSERADAGKLTGAVFPGIYKKGLKAIEGPTNFLVQDILKVARKIGPYHPKKNGRHLIPWLCAWGAGVWGPEDCDAILELVQLGYADSYKWNQYDSYDTGIFKDEKLSNLYEWLGDRFDASRAPKIMRQLDGKRRQLLVRQMRERDLPPETLPSLLLALREAPKDFRDFYPSISRTGNPLACQVFLDAEASGQIDYAYATQCLIQISLRSQVQVVRDSLQELALRPRKAAESKSRTRAARASRSGTQSGSIASARALLVTRMVQLGDPRVFVHYATYESLGLNVDIQSVFWIPIKNAFHNVRGAPTWFYPNGGTTLHSYTQQQLAAGWAVLLKGSDSTIPAISNVIFWGKNTNCRWLDTNHGRIAAGPGKASTDLVKVCLDYVTEALDLRKSREATWSRGHDQLLATLLGLSQRVTKLPASLKSRLQALSVQCIVSNDRTLIALALQEFQSDDVRPTQAQTKAILDVLPKLEHSSEARIATRIFAAREIPLSAFSAGLQTPSAEVKRIYLHGLSPVAGDGLIEVLTKLLDDDDPATKLAICNMLARKTDRSAVPALIEALKDRSEKVRAAARDALQSIRFYHEQGRYWQNSAGPDLSPNAAAQKLLEQADAKQDEATRVTAIRALGALGVTATLPYLIEASREKSPAIQAAAKEAIDRILR